MVQVYILYLTPCHVMEAETDSYMYLGSPRPELGTSKSEWVQIKITWQK